MSINYTLSYSEGVKGFPSFYSYIPDIMVGMNQYFYSFKGGNLFRHNTNNTRNNYYGVQYNSKITSVFNPNPLQNKLFKTLNLESDGAWQATLTTDIQLTGFIDSSYFEKKEASWFAFIRNNGPTGANTNQAEWELRSLNGIGKSASTSGTAASYEINFPLSTDIGSIISVGDFLYYSLPPSFDTPVFAGVVTNINVDLPNSVNKLVIDSTTQPGTTNPIPIQNAFIFYIKNPIAESHGVLGHYCIFELENTSTTPTELFAVESDIMKSYP
tara:strand:- start:69 stop:881 length:813 start_codon:yes stop_codon:yes gene_type:complete